MEKIYRYIWAIIGILAIIGFFFAISNSPNYEKLYQKEKYERETEKKRTDSVIIINQQLDCENEILKKKQIKLEKQVDTLRKQYEKNAIRYHLPSLEQLLSSSD